MTPSYSNLPRNIAHGAIPRDKFKRHVNLPHHIAPGAISRDKFTADRSVPAPPTEEHR